MPIGFWNDPDGKKYQAAYFERFDNVWCHGDFAEWTAHGGLIIHGRSDATLNPGGVRIGTAEIYNQVEQMPEILEALCIGQDFDNDVRVVLFVRLADGVALDADLEKRIRAKIRTGASPRHVPAKIVAVTDIPTHQIGQDHRACGARRRAWPRHQEQGSARQSRSARAVPQPAAAGGLMHAAKECSGFGRAEMAFGLVNKICRSNLPRFHEWYTFVNFPPGR